MVDQSPIGKTTRSNRRAMSAHFDEIRNIFCRQKTSKERGYTAGTFSFNSGNGRCPPCGGNGFEHVEMAFRPTSTCACPTATAALPGRSPSRSRCGTIHGDVLDMTVSQALSFFFNNDDVVRRLKPLVDVGSDYSQARPARADAFAARRSA